MPSHLQVGSSQVKVLEYKESVKYLGRKVCLHDPHEVELSNRIAAAWGTFSKHKTELTDRRYRLKDRLRLFSATVTACVLYGCECWVLRKEQQKTLQATQRKMLRMLLHAKRRKTDESGSLEPWADFLRRSAKWVEEKLQAAGQNERLEIWQQRQTKWAERLSKGKERWSEIATVWKPFLHSGSRRGRAKARPRKTWKAQVEGQGEL